MKKTGVFTVISLIIFCMILNAVPQDRSLKLPVADPGKSAVPDYQPGTVLVKFKRGITASAIDSLVNSLDMQVKKRFRVLSARTGFEYVLISSKSRNTDNMVTALSRNSRIEAVSPNYRRYISDTPDDPLYGNLWGMHNTGQNGGTADADIDAPEAWTIQTGSQDVIVAVIDTGVDYNHPDLAPNMWTNSAEQSGTAGVDDDGNGYIDDIYGIDAAGADGSAGDTDPMDYHSHGTHCSGTIGAKGNNSLGVAGVNWNVKIMGLKFFDNSGGSGYDSFSIECIEYVIDQKINYGQNIVAINASWGGSGFNQLLKDAIAAAGSAGIIFCAAAGNDGTDNDATPHYPSSYDLDCILAVANSDRNDLLSGSSNYGAVSVDLAAPGSSILSTVPGIHEGEPGDIVFDDMESGSGNWTHSGTKDTWTITTDQEGFANDSYPVPSPTHFWSDNPGADYQTDTNAWLAWATDIDLSGCSGQDIFLGIGSAMYIEADYDHAYVEISKDSGATWEVLHDFSGYGRYWSNYSWPIPDSFKTAHFRFRFRLVSDNYVQYWGWLIDNVGIGTELTYGYGYKSGTSMATPHVAGSVGLMAAQFPAETVTQRINRLKINADPLAGLSGKCTTGARLNLYKAITGSHTPMLTVSAPNGGESWLAGSVHSITWSAVSFFGNVTIEYSADNGGSWNEIVSDTANTGTFSWTVPNTPATQCLVRVYAASGGIPADTSDATFAIVENPDLPVLAVNRTQLNFATSAGFTTRSQDVLVSNEGGGTLNWSTVTDAAWLTCSPVSGSGLARITLAVDSSSLSAGTYTGNVTVSAAGADQSPRVIAVTLRVYAAGAGSAPFGTFTTPVNDSTVRSSVPVTGWVLDDVETESVKIFRESGENLVFIGDAVFVEGARPDVESAFPAYPLNYRAGWGYMLLTYGLPDQGMNNDFIIRAIATDAEGNETDLGSKLIHCDNQNAVKPFGAIDRPFQGGEASGSYINWGWALTPNPNSIPFDGSTINVVVDGVIMGHPVYNNYRSDIATRYPGYANSDGAVGHFTLDTTAFANGTHTISWQVQDSAGNIAGIGSRFFTIVNLAAGSAAAKQLSVSDSAHSAMNDPAIVFDHLPVRVQRGSADSTGRLVYPRFESPDFVIPLEEVQVLALHLFPDQPKADDIAGFMRVGRELRPLPVGSTLDRVRGIFYWQPGPGFVGSYDFVFFNRRKHTRKNISVQIAAKRFP